MLSSLLQRCSSSAMELPYYHDPPNTRLRSGLTLAGTLILLASAVYTCWPSDPTLKIVRLSIDKLHIHNHPHIINIDLSLTLTIEVSNVGLYSMDFRSLDVAVGYRGKRLGHARSDSGHVRAWASSNMDADLEFKGMSVSSDVVFLLEDLAKGLVPFDTVTEVTGNLGLFFLGFPSKAKMSCEVLVNVSTQTIAHHNCYTPEE